MGANAAIGEINPTLIGSTLVPFPTTPPPSCVERCSEVPSQNTPECNGQARDRCLQMSRYENKCLWIECQASTPTSSTSTTTSFTPSPAPSTSPSPSTSPMSESRMVPADVPQGHRCKGAPLSDWGGLGSRLSPSQCLDACLADVLCNFAVYKEDNRRCSSFGSCSDHMPQIGFLIWEKVRHVAASTTSSSTAVSTTTSSSSTMAATTTSPSSTWTSTASTTSCPREAQIIACVSQGGIFECKRCTDVVLYEPCCSCKEGEDHSSTTTTTTRASGLCKSFCSNSSKSWQKKCSWNGCLGCPECNARRLRGNVLYP